MAITFDASTKRIIMDSATVTASDIYLAWRGWVVLSDNLKYLPAFREVGGDDLGSGLSIPPYLFLMNGWRVRPMESNHTLVITGNLFVDGGGVPVVQTLGSYNVSVQYTVPVQAQGISTAGSDPSTIAAAVWGHSTGVSMTTKLAEAWARLGLDPSAPLVTGTTSITFGSIAMALTDVGGTVTVTRS